MPLTRPFPIDKAYPNAIDLRKQASGIYPREGLFPDPITVAAAGVAYGNGGWNVGARPFVANIKRGAAPFTQAYGSAQLTNDSAATAWTIPAAPTSGSRIDRLWVRATDPTSGEALTTPSGETVARAVPIFGVTSGVAATTPALPALPAGVEEIARVQTPSTATSIAQSTITQVYSFANVLGSPIYFRTAAELLATTTGIAIGETAYALDTGETWLWTGSTWIGGTATYTPVLSGATPVGTGSNGGTSGTFRNQQGLVTMQGRVSFGTGLNIGAGALRLSLPVPARALPVGQRIPGQYFYPPLGTLDAFLYIPAGGGSVANIIVPINETSNARADLNMGNATGAGTPSRAGSYGIADSSNLLFEGTYLGA